MGTDRRDFLGALLATSVVPNAVGHRAAGYHGVRLATRLDSPWDVSWADRIKGAHKAVFDSPEITMGLAFLRALVWIKDYGEVYGAKPSDMSAVVVARHNGIWMVMDDEFWDHHGVGAITRIDDPKTGKPIRRNPFLGPSPFPDMPPAADAVLKTVLGTATVLACNLAFQDVVDAVKKQEKVDDAAARSMALHHLVPGVILQPSGVFAVTRAEEAGCSYLLAS